MSWVFLSIFAGFVWALVNLMDKFVFVRWKLSPNVFFVAISATFFLSAFPVWAVKGVQPISPYLLGLALVAGIFYFFCYVFYYRALQNEEVSRVVPLWYLAPFFLLILAAIFLGERLKMVHILGTVLLVFGAITITSKSFFSRPNWRTIGLMVLADLFFALSAVLSKHLLSSMDVWSLYVYTRLAGIFVLIPCVLLYGKELLQTVREKGRGFLAVVFGEEIVNCFGDFAYLLAMAIGSVTLVTALSSLQPFFVFLICSGAGLLVPGFLQEDKKLHFAVKGVSILAIFIGALLVT